MLINCVGDSHANFFSGYDIPQPEWPGENIRNRYPFFKCYRLGPVLAYNLCEENTTTQGREKLFQLLAELDPGSYLLFCFGEIDCRAHIYLQSQKQKRTTGDIVTEVVERYFLAIKEVQELGFNTLVWNVIPSAPSDINERIHVPSQYLFHGTSRERNDITGQFNRSLTLLCQEYNIPFISIFDQLINREGTVRRDYYCDEIHLGQTAMPLVLKQFNDVFPGFYFVME
ncbi:SGNH/GDSL hydrolase family protein [bacterium]|nr:SGNH/GDSL hydrolase family protein [bacterium]